jgi:hypothetical protein
MASFLSQSPFADPPAAKSRPDPVDWRWIDAPPGANDNLPKPAAPHRYDEIPADTFRAGGDTAGCITQASERRWW